ncbi:MAG: hypothetical protein K1X46_09690 [Chitinophagaceae bacterium]|nr:hypothetical protein [Chitinophagaceae bacterium]
MQQLKEFLAFPFKIILLLRFKKLIKNAFTILKPNGIIFISTPNRERVWLSIGEKTDIPPHHF